MATGTLSASEYLSREKRQLKKKLIQEILCQLEQVNLDQLQVKDDVRSGVQERPAFCGGRTESEAFKDFVHTLLLEYVELERRCLSCAEGHILNLVHFVLSAQYDRPLACYTLFLFRHVHIRSW